MHDWLADESSIWPCNVVDDFNRGGLGIEVDLLDKSANAAIERGCEEKRRYECPSKTDVPNDQLERLQRYGQGG